MLAVCGALASVVATVAWPGVQSNPLTVAGSSFRPHERVRVTATVASEKRTRAVTAGRTGRFRVEFEQLGASRCDLIRVVAVRRSGRLVVVKRLPAPACSTA